MQTPAPARGDCEDYALEKRAMLTARGWPLEALSLAMAMSDRGVHAALIAHTDRGDFVLDNFFDPPRGIERSPYRWLSMQTGGDFRTWRGVRVVTGARAEAAGAA
jgi:predicted transglutaminase-like cysteine proteinase